MNNEEFAKTHQYNVNAARSLIPFLINTWRQVGRPKNVDEHPVMKQLYDIVNLLVQRCNAALLEEQTKFNQLMKERYLKKLE